MGLGVLVIILLIGVFFLFSENSPTIQESSKQVSELILSLSDLPKDYEISDKAPRVNSDVSEEGIINGWIEGYYAEFQKGGDTILDGTWIYQAVSRYPIENISNLAQVRRNKENVIYESISIKIGDKSNAYKITEQNGLFNKESYAIEFIKKDIYIYLEISGVDKNFELLTDLAKKVEEEI